MNSEQTPEPVSAPELTSDSAFKKHFCHVTPLSKYLAMVVVIMLPFIGGAVGYYYAPEKVVEKEALVLRDRPEQVIEKTIEDEVLTDDTEFLHPVVIWKNNDQDDNNEVITFDTKWLTDESHKYHSDTTVILDKPIHVLVRDKESGEVTDFSYEYEDLNKSEIAPGLFYDTGNLQQINYELTNNEAWVMYSTPFLGKGGPSSGVILVGNKNAVFSGGWINSIAQFEWLDGGMYRHKVYVHCDEADNYSSENYTPETDPGCDGVGSAFPFVISDEWTYGDISDLLEKLEEESE